MEFSDFILRFEPGDRHSQRTYHVLARSSAGAEAKGLFSIPQALQKGGNLLGEWQQTLSVWMKGGRDPQGSRSPTLAERAGTELFHSLFRGSILNLFDFEVRRNRKQSHLGLSLRLHFAVEGQDWAQLESLPWELLRDPRAPFTAVQPIQPIRSITGPHPVHPLPLSLPLRVLAVISRPPGMPAPAQSFNRSQDFLHQAFGIKPGVELTVLESPSLDELQLAISRSSFHILHFSGHTSSHGKSQRTSPELAGLKDDSGLVSEESFTNLLKATYRPHGPRLVFLDACYAGSSDGKVTSHAGVAAKLVQSGIPAVVDMNYPISDRAALRFSRTFYERLATGSPVEAAVSEGRLAMAREDPQEWAMPSLYIHASPGELFTPSERVLDPQDQKQRDRHAELVDKKFRTSLTESEQAELLRLQEELDEADAKFYEPIEQRLELALAKLRQRSR